MVFVLCADLVPGPEADAARHLARFCRSRF